MVRLRTPIRKLGPKKTRWDRWHVKQRTRVVFRAESRCERCGISGQSLEWHHIYGRGNTIGEPWCSSAELTTALCLDCHREMTNHPERNDTLRVVALQRFADRYELPPLTVSQVSEPLGTMRALTDLLEAKGYAYDATNNTITQGE